MLQRYKMATEYNKKNYNKPLLSLCIPTYNRAKYLESTIKSIVLQDEFINGKVEIIISDNASSDNTQSMCLNYEKQYNNFYYFRNEVNIYDRNFPLSLSRANGIYRKLLNDSHIYLPKALNYMCDIIAKHYDDKPYIYWAIARFTTNRVVNGEYRCDYEKFLTITGEHVTNIVSFGMWESDEQYINNDSCELKLWQAEESLKLAKIHRDIIIYTNVLVEEQIVINKDISYNVFEIFHDNYLKILSKYTSSETAISKIKKNMLFDTFYHWRLKWDDNQSNLQFDRNNSDLPSEIANAYSNNVYYIFYLLKIRIAEFCRKIKRYFFD